MDGTLQERAQATRRKVLEAAAGLFDTQGYAATSISDITARSGRTSGAVYFHYANKEGVALAVVRDRFASWEHLRRRYTASVEPPVETLVGLSFDVAGCLAEDIVTRAGARLWAERATVAAPLPDPFGLWTTAAVRLLARARTAGQLAGRVSPARTAPALVRSFYGVCALTEPLEGSSAVTDRLAEWWCLVLPALQGDTDPAPLVARARAVPRVARPA